MITMHDVRALLEQINEPVLSLYLNVDPGAEENQANTPTWRIWLKNTLRDIENTLDDAQRDIWSDISARVGAYLNHYRPESKSLILFVGPTFMQDYMLALPVVNQADFGTPLVVPLVWLLDEFKRYLIVLVDKQDAYFLTTYLGHVGQQDHIEIDIEDYDWGQKTLMPATSHGKMLNQGSNREAFEAMLDEHRARYYREVAAHVEEMCQQHETTRIILGGSEASAHIVRGYMPDRVAQLVVDILPIPMKKAPHEILERVLPTALAYERQYEADLVDEVINLAKSDGRGALGSEMVTNALEQQRVELLIVPYPIEDKQLELELPLRALASSSAIELVHGEVAERLKDEGRIAARLYYVL